MINLIKYKYMVVFELPEKMSPDFMSLIQPHKLKVANYFDQNILLSYTLSHNLRKLWAVFVAKSKEEVEDYINGLPLSKYMTYDIHELMFHESNDTPIPSFSLN